MDRVAAEGQQEQHCSELLPAKVLRSTQKYVLSGLSSAVDRGDIMTSCEREGEVVVVTISRPPQEEGRWGGLHCKFRQRLFRLPASFGPDTFPELSECDYPHRCQMLLHISGQHQAEPVWVQLARYPVAGGQAQYVLTGMACALEEHEDIVLRDCCRQGPVPVLHLTARQRGGPSGQPSEYCTKLCHGSFELGVRIVERVFPHVGSFPHDCHTRLVVHCGEQQQPEEHMLAARLTRQSGWSRATRRKAASAAAAAAPALAAATSPAAPEPEQAPAPEAAGPSAAAQQAPAGAPAPAAAPSVLWGYALTGVGRGLRQYEDVVMTGCRAEGEQVVVTITARKRSAAALQQKHRATQQLYSQGREAGRLKRAAEQPPLRQRMPHAAGAFSLPVHVARGVFADVTTFPHECSVQLLVNGQQAGDGRVLAKLIRYTCNRTCKEGGLIHHLKGFDGLLAHYWHDKKGYATMTQCSRDAAGVVVVEVSASEPPPEEPALVFQPVNKGIVHLGARLTKAIFPGLTSFPHVCKVRVVEEGAGAGAGAGGTALQASVTRQESSNSISGLAAAVRHLAQPLMTGCSREGGAVVITVGEREQVLRQRPELQALADKQPQHPDVEDMSRMASRLLRGTDFSLPPWVAHSAFGSIGSLPHRCRAQLVTLRLLALGAPVQVTVDSYSRQNGSTGWWLRLPAGCLSGLSDVMLVRCKAEEGGLLQLKVRAKGQLEVQQGGQQQGQAAAGVGSTGRLAWRMLLSKARCAAAAAGSTPASVQQSHTAAGSSEASSQADASAPEHVVLAGAQQQAGQ